MKKARGVLGVAIAWMVVYGLFALKLPATFGDPRNLELMMRQSIIDGLGAIGMTYVIISRGIDLSAGSVVALATVFCALVIKSTGRPELAVLACAGLGALSGLINGTIISRLRVGPFIVTLASMLAIRGVAKGIAGEQTVGDVPDTWIRSLTTALGPTEHWMLMPRGAWCWLLLLVLFALALQYTVFGRNVVAIGSNESTARLCGVKVEWVKTGVYVLAGTFFGLAGIVQFARTTIGDPTIASGEELKMIAAVVIGGASLSGGEGSVVGALFGTLIMTTINMGCTQLGFPNWVQEILTGLIILLAVGLDKWRMARKSEYAA